MSSLHKMLAGIRELDVAELNQVGGGEFSFEDEMAADMTTQCYTDSRGTKHCVSNRDPC